MNVRWLFRASPSDRWLLRIGSGVVKPGGQDWKATTYRLEELDDQYPRSLMSCHAHSPNAFTCLGPGEMRYGCLMNVPLCSSVTACRNCSWVFMTIGPYHATGSSIGLPDTNRKRIPCSPA